MAARHGWPHSRLLLRLHTGVNRYGTAKVQNIFNLARIILRGTCKTVCECSASRARCAIAISMPLPAGVPVMRILPVVMSHHRCAVGGYLPCVDVAPSVHRARGGVPMSRRGTVCRSRLFPFWKILHLPRAWRAVPPSLPRGG